MPDPGSSLASLRRIDQRAADLIDHAQKFAALIESLL
jgi:hypothetical protein